MTPAKITFCKINFDIRSFTSDKKEISQKRAQTTERNQFCYFKQFRIRRRFFDMIEKRKQQQKGTTRREREREKLTRALNAITWNMMKIC